MYKTHLSFTNIGYGSTFFLLQQNIIFIHYFSTPVKDWRGRGRPRGRFLDPVGGESDMNGRENRIIVPTECLEDRMLLEVLWGQHCKA